MVGLLVGMSLFSMFFFISLYLQQVLGYEPLEAGPRLPAAERADHHQRRRGLAAGDAHRLQADADRGLLFIAAGLLWFSQVSPGRQLRRRRPVPVDARRRSASASSFVPVTIAAVTGTKPGRGRPGVGADQHLPAGRRRPRPGDHRHGGQLDHRRRVRRRRAHPAVALTRGLPGRVPGLRRASRCSARDPAAALISSKDSREHAEAARRATPDPCRRPGSSRAGRFGGPGPTAGSEGGACSASAAPPNRVKLCTGHSADKTFTSFHLPAGRARRAPPRRHPGRSGSIRSTPSCRPSRTVPSRSVRSVRRPPPAGRSVWRERDGRRCSDPTSIAATSGRRRSAPRAGPGRRCRGAGPSWPPPAAVATRASVGLSASPESNRSKPAGADQRRHRPGVRILGRRPGRPRPRREHADGDPPGPAASRRSLGAQAARPAAQRRLTTAAERGVPVPSPPSTSTSTGIRSTTSASPPWWSREAWVITSTERRRTPARAEPKATRRLRRPAVEQHGRAVGVLDQGGVALTDVEEGHGHPVRRRRGPQAPGRRHAAITASGPPAAARRARGSRRQRAAAPPREPAAARAPRRAASAAAASTR